MVDSKKNHKFDLGVKGLTDLQGNVKQLEGRINNQILGVKGLSSHPQGMAEYRLTTSYMHMFHRRGVF